VGSRRHSSKRSADFERKVTIALYCVELAFTCAARAMTFTEVLRQAGATDITVVDSANLAV
jgi:hypothetical protein